MRAAASQTAGMWSWLDERADRHGGRQPVALITHKPVTATETELAAAPPHRFWPPFGAGFRRIAGTSQSPSGKERSVLGVSAQASTCRCGVPEVGRFITFS